MNENEKIIAGNIFWKIILIGVKILPYIRMRSYSSSKFILLLSELREFHSVHYYMVFKIGLRDKAMCHKLALQNTIAKFTKMSSIFTKS